MWCQTYGYLPSCRASPPLDQYQIVLHGVRGTCVWTSCPGLLSESETAGSRIHDLQSPRSNALTTTPPGHVTQQYINSAAWQTFTAAGGGLLCWTVCTSVEGTTMPFSDKPSPASGWAAASLCIHLHTAAALMPPSEQRWVYRPRVQIFPVLHYRSGDVPQNSPFPSKNPGPNLM